MVNNTPPNSAHISPEVFAAHCNNLYYNTGLAEEPQHTPPLTALPPITSEEVLLVLQKHFKGRVSSGMCPLPSQVFQHLRGQALEHLTALINKWVRDSNPPAALKSTKLVPLFKGKGSEVAADNYRALAVMHPLAKLIMGVLN